MLIKIYNHNSLKLNGDKTEFLNFSRDNNDDESKFTITDDQGNIIDQKSTIKVLGYIINQKNDLEGHLSALFGKISKQYNNIKGAIPFLSERNKKIIIDVKLRGQLNLTLLLIINQTQRVQEKACVLLMRINKWIYGKPVFRKENKEICTIINKPLPEQEILQASGKFIHKIMSRDEKISLNNYIGQPTRSTSKIFHMKPKKKTLRTPLEHHIHLYNQMPSDLKYLKPKTLSYKLRKRDLEYRPPD